MNPLKKTPPTIWFIVLSCVLITLLRLCRVFDAAELFTYDLRFQLRPLQPALQEVVVIAIDDRSLNALGTWPLPRDMHATLVNALTEMGARAIVFDILFAEPAPADALLSESIEKSGNVFLPVAFYIPEKQPSSQLIASDHEVLADVIAPLKPGAAGMGHINVEIDTDGKARRIPLFIQRNGLLVPQISLLAAAKVMGINIDHVRIFDDHLVLADNLTIPVVDSNSLLVNYVGTWNESFKRVSYLEVLQEYVQLKEGTLKEGRLDLRNTICFVGLTATGTSDLRAMPLEKYYPMLGVQANVFQSIVQRSFIRDAGTTLNVALNLGIFLVSFLLCWRIFPMRAFFAVLTLSIGYFVVAIILFCYAGWWIDLFFPLLTIGLTYVAALGARLFQERRKRELFEKELQIAQDIQKSFLPKTLPQIESLSIGAFLKSSRVVGGDLYDVIKFSDEKIGFLIGDVAGKGISASLIMAQVISIFSLLSRTEQEGPKLFHQLNNELCKRMSGRFVTALYVLIDLSQRKGYATSAGHGPLLIFKPGQEKVAEIALAPNIPLGLMDNSEYAHVSFDLDPHDKIVMLTDGVFEARNKKEEEFGLDRIRAIMLKSAQRTGRELLGSLQEALFTFEDTHSQYDDITMLVIELQDKILALTEKA